ncbi:MAG: DUF1857 family protein [Gammaproteobacteria bacterium]|nr:DUF1857 family protein [Gammaproteobacteria bacterium]MDP2142054.1 DUF1857 family protein [Gammaproteobacteria bacterium]MDP2348367.1 DUF1857 family protein [Gammaproteobacteria bacterium]
MLEFQHIIQINTPDEPVIPRLHREQLWEGLVFRTKYPGHFNATLSARLENVTHAGFVRYLRFGSGELRDEVMLTEGQEIRTSTAGSAQQMFAESITRIEEPLPGHLFVRFMYRRDSGNEPGGLDVDEYLKAAYVQNDRDAIALLRQFAVHGLPGTGSWIQ